MPSSRQHIRADKVGVGSQVLTPGGDEVTVIAVAHVGPLAVFHGETENNRSRYWAETKGDTLYVWGPTKAYKKPPAGKVQKLAKKVLGGKGGRR